ncbi:uncharacterized protein LOC124933555 isoform X2 [Impatiens glandulifera]|uniref:uncharacterized protein LOC124933555 isoform X2 n=1 Tax=Impatiens glandulifera TaxID=253017 RepID=UPI001FB17261|nr:uncharacterized protein LOC124933555 isoform X2 [Impatiens glandulifera]
MDPSITDPGIIVWSQPEPPATYMEPIGNLVLPPSYAGTTDHTPYPEMITAAIAALGEPEGSSRQAIAKYIEQTYANLPDNNAVLLTRYLKQMKQTGQLEMVKHSYLLPGSVPVFEQPITGDESAVVSDSGMKRRPGRPPKVKNGDQVIGDQVNGDQVQESVFVSLGLEDKDESTHQTTPTMLGKRGRGRPPKSQSSSVIDENGSRRGRGRPRKIESIGLGSRSRGSKPRKVAKQSAGRPRGRPRKYAILPAAMDDGGASEVVVGGGGGGGGITPAKRRGRLPLGGMLKKRRSLSGKPLGRPRKAHGDLLKKLENIQLKVKEVIDVVKPHLNPITASIAIDALQELEQLAQVQQQKAVPTATTTASAQPSPVLTTSSSQEQIHFPNPISHFPISTAPFSTNNTAASPSPFPVYPSQFQASYPPQGPII